MSSIIKVDAIQKADGTTPTMADLGLNDTGTVLAYHETTRFNNWSLQTTTATEILDAAQRLTFSPKFSNSKLVVRLSMDVKWSGGNRGTKIFVYRDGSNIGSNFTNGTFLFGYQESANNNNHFTMSNQIMIDANNTNSTTFTVYASRFDTSGNSEGGHWAPTVLSVTEIAG